MSHLQSINAAARLNDFFVQQGWHKYGLYAYPTRRQIEVILQYKSESRGDTRSVICDPLKMETWLRKNLATYGVVAKLFDLLDRKPELSTSAEQPTLFPTSELAPVVKRSMNPNEQ